MVERVKIDTPGTHIYDHSLSWLDTGSSIKKCIFVDMIMCGFLAIVSMFMGTNIR